jgi:N-acetylmuramoyl-L-alanine amidase
VPSPPPGPAPAAAGGGVDAGTQLSYGKDARGSYAVYRLKKGEALYSAVVVRFTGQLHAAEVNATARKIAKRSGIEDVSAIPIGYPVKIPLDLLLPEYLPPGDPRREAWERERTELASFAEAVRAADLSGVHVILDAGHGGVDSGAVKDGVWESVYAYDLLCRIKHDLERHTRATVWPTILDRSRGHRVVDRDVLPPDRDQVLLTHPRFALDDSALGVHLRWYLANDIVLRLRRKGVPASRIVFLSLHADSLHPSVRGAMAYVPSRHLRPRSYRARKRGISRFREYRDHPTVKLGSRLTTRAEASSRRLASILIRGLRDEQLEVHPYSPIRGSVLRGRRRWVPAVLRYSLAQNAVLLECCNLSNEEDRKLLLQRSWRERFARAVVRGLARAFGGNGRH